MKPVIPPKILLTWYHSTRLRLVGAQLPFGVSMTKFVNEAVCEKLDRDQPQTIGMDAAPPPEPVKSVPSWEDVKRSAVSKELEGVYCLHCKGTLIYNVKLKEHKKLGAASPGLEALLEDLFIKSGEALSDEKKAEILKTHAQKKLEAVKESKMEDYSEIPDDVKGHPVKYAAWDAKRQAFLAGQAVEAPQDDGERMMQMEGLAPAATSDSDFWGEDDFSKGLDLIKRHAR